MTCVRAVWGGDQVQPGSRNPAATLRFYDSAMVCRNTSGPVGCVTVGPLSAVTKISKFRDGAGVLNSP
jgi:hypothetical protein